jgi:hypothetical protein
MWACIGDADHPYVVFDFAAGYAAEGPEEFLSGYKGYFQADALRLPKRTRRAVPSPLGDATTMMSPQEACR